MSSMDIIERELKQYLEEAQNLSRADRYIHLRAIFDKHFAMEQTSYLLTMSDLQFIISTAKQNFVQMILPATVSNKDLSANDAPHVAMVEAILSNLNKAGLLRRLVKVDITTRTGK